VLGHCSIGLNRSPLVARARNVPQLGRGLLTGHSTRDKLRLVIDPAAIQMVLVALTGWLERRQRDAVVYLSKRIGSCVDSSGTDDCA